MRSNFLWRVAEFFQDMGLLKGFLNSMLFWTQMDFSPFSLTRLLMVRIILCIQSIKLLGWLQILFLCILIYFECRFLVKSCPSSPFTTASLISFFSLPYSCRPLNIGHIVHVCCSQEPKCLFSLLVVFLWFKFLLTLMKRFPLSNSWNLTEGIFRNHVW